MANTVPNMSTQACTDVSFTTATGNGTVVSNGNKTVSENGVCAKLGEGQTPTTADLKFVGTPTQGTSGSFTSAMTGLTAGSIYSVRSYGINSIGTGYGNTITLGMKISVSVAESLAMSETLD